MAGLPPRDPHSREQARRLRRQQVRRRRMVLGIVVLLILVLIIILLVVRPGCEKTPSSTSAGSTTASTGQTTSTLPPTNKAELTGANNVPPVDTQSTGMLTLTVDAADATVSFVLEVDGLTNTSVAKIYQGTAGTNGEAIVTLFDGPTIEGPHKGIVAKGTIGQADLTGPLAGQGIAELIALIQSGDTYCVVGNTSHPDGAIRGQID